MNKRTTTICHIRTCQMVRVKHDGDSRLFKCCHCSVHLWCIFRHQILRMKFSHLVSVHGRTKETERLWLNVYSFEFSPEKQNKLFYKYFFVKLECMLATPPPPSLPLDVLISGPTAINKCEYD